MNFRIEKEEYAEAFRAVSSRKNLLGRREVRGGILLSLILITVFTIPASIGKYGTFYTQAILIAVFLLLFYLLVFWDADQERKTAERDYETNALLKLENSVSLYRDSLVYQNAYETYSHYLSDFSLCVETENMFVFAGGERDLLIVKKEGAEAEALIRAGENLRDFYTARYFRVGRRKKG